MVDSALDVSQSASPVRDAVVLVAPDDGVSGKRDGDSSIVRRAGRWCRWYLLQWKGVGDMPPGVPPYIEIGITFVGAFSALLLILALNAYVSPMMYDIPWVITSFGASTTLLFAVPEAKLCQPRNCVGGQLIGAVVGVCVRLAVGGEYLWISGALGTALAITIMQATRCTHPPGGGTALAASTMPKLLPYQGFQIVITAMIGNVCLVLVALLVNNVSPKRRYPLYWINEKW